MASTDCITMVDLPPELTAEYGTQHTTSRALAPDHGLREKLRQIECQIISDALSSTGGDRKATADILGIHLSSLYRKLEEFAELKILVDKTSEQ